MKELKKLTFKVQNYETILDKPKFAVIIAKFSMWENLSASVREHVRACQNSVALVCYTSH
jgi:hypothetical protein